MSTKKRLVDVFKTVGLPPYTYVKPSHYGEVRAGVEQPGEHLLIEGPSGAGKTCVVYKVFEELGWVDGTHYSYVSCRDQNSEKAIRTFFERAAAGEMPSPPLIVVDDFHLLSPARRAAIGSSLKR